MAVNDIYGLKKNQDGSFTEIEIRATLNVQTSCIKVDAIGTAAENGTALNAAYTAAKAMTPYGAALSATNRVRIVVAPGKYTLSLAVNTQFIDFVSLDGNRSILLSEINVTASDVYLKGINMGNAFTVATALPLLICENCKGSDYSFGYSDTSSIDISSTFINCTAGNHSFGVNPNSGDATFSGTAINCIGGYYCFGHANANSGTFSGIATNCTAYEYSFGFGSISSIFSGKVINCTAGNYSFGLAWQIADAYFCIRDGVVFGKQIVGFNSLGLAGVTASQIIQHILSFGNLINANLTGADLTSANLSYTDLSFANLSFGNLTSANLNNAILTSADLNNAILTSADLTSTNLTSADLSFANLSFGNLTSADLTSAILTSVNLTSANLTGAILTSANLSYTDLTSANLTSATGLDPDINVALTNVDKTGGYALMWTDGTIYTTSGPGQPFV